ncbi:MAG: hypothetical protein LBG15_11255 [Dysgonamonadaceae bacterium]|nr:hypothetical protein [Dysgonamonadaceae bacterium]
MIFPPLAVRLTMLRLACDTWINFVSV